jgi:hypothetical protein
MMSTLIAIANTSIRPAPLATAPALEADSTVLKAPINVSRPSKSVNLPDNLLPCVCRDRSCAVAIPDVVGIHAALFPALPYVAPSAYPNVKPRPLLLHSEPPLRAMAFVLKCPVRVASQAVDRRENDISIRKSPGRSTTLWRRDYFDVALSVGNLNSHGIIPAFEK